VDALKNILLVLTVVALATVGVLLLASGGDGTFEHKGLARVEHSQEDVFEWLLDPTLRVQYVAGLSSSKADMHRVEKGAHLVEIVGEGQDQHERRIEVLEAVAGSTVAMRITEPGRTLEVHYRLSPNQSNKRTRVEYVLSGHFDAWWARVLEPFLSSRAIDELEADLLRLDQTIHRV
jgi:uncharacterized protein YndB with AHSA1/START domain